MPEPDTSIQIRSYRGCFQLEHRLYRIDNWRIPLPYGVPLRGLAYTAVIAFAVLVLDGLPLSGPLIGAIHPIVAYLMLPVALAYVLIRVKVDGRPVLAFVGAWLRHQLGPRRVAAFRAAPASGPVRLGDVALAPDHSGARLRRGVVEGPARVILRYPVQMEVRGRSLEVRQEGEMPQWRGKQVNLRAGQRVVAR